MESVSALQTVRCPACRRKTIEGEFRRLMIKCPRCKIFFEVCSNNGRLNYTICPVTTPDIATN